MAMLVTPTPSPGPGWKTYFTEAGDDPTLGRGKGQRLRASMAGEDEATVDLSFNEPVWFHDGELSWNPSGSFNADDSFSLSIILPATEATPNPGNTGNCILVPYGPGNVIIPAAGNGTHDIDLDQAVPVPSTEQKGYWDVNVTTGEVSFDPSHPLGATGYNLLDFSIETFFIPSIGMGNPLGIFAVDAYQSDWVSDRWYLRLKVNKVSAGAGEVGGWLMVYRRHTTTF